MAKKNGNGRTGLGLGKGKRSAPATKTLAGKRAPASSARPLTSARMAKKPIEQYDHKDKTRINNPPVGLVTKDTEPLPDATPKKTYAYDAHLDPAISFDPQAIRQTVSQIIQDGLSDGEQPALDRAPAAATLAETVLAATQAKLSATQEALGRARHALRALEKAQAPYLNWSGKAERLSFSLPTVSLHVHERIDPKTIIEVVRTKNGKGLHNAQLPLFESADENPPLREAIDFYRHDHNWANRLIAGDSLLVMNSLLEKEGMAGKVQMVYIDPPYGIKYGSNFQPFVNKREVKEGKDEDLTQEPEMLKAFRDTWELGIHSYLTYLRDRLWLAKDLLHESGSCFVQIGNENVHHVRELMDEVFHSRNFVAIVSVRKTATPSKLLDDAFFYIVWYAKNADSIKCHNLFLDKPCDEWARETPGGSWGVEIDGKRRPLTPEEKRDTNILPPGARVYCLSKLTSAGAASEEVVFEFDGKKFTPGANSHWKTAPVGLQKLVWANRIEMRDRPWFVRFHGDNPLHRLTTLFDDTAGKSGESMYVVQTQPDVVQRCMLMTTDPGDLVFDPTCGSGTTGYVAEQWGRRWITCDTSRVAITLAKQRFMTKVFSYYKLAHPVEGVGSGFTYKTVPHVTLKSIANNPEIRPGMSRKAIDAAIQKYADQETLYDRPEIDTSRARVTGPFTVEAVPAPVVRPVGEVDEVPASDASVARSGVTLRARDWRDELLKTGVRGRSGQRISFTRVEPLAGTRWLHADAETKEEPSPRPSPGVPGEGGKRVVVSFGPDHAPLEQTQVERAWEEARTLNPRPAMILFAAFQFDPEAAKDIDELTLEKTGMTFLKVQMNTDLLTEDLKKKRASNESFWLMGQPDVEVRRIAEGEDKGKYQAQVNGFDYYNPKTGSIESGDTSRIAMWMLDTDYDGRSIYPRQVFFPMAGDKEGWAKLANSLRAEIDGERIQAYRGTVSLPFEAGGHKRVAVKIVDDRGIESLKIVEL